MKSSQCKGCKWSTELTQDEFNDLFGSFMQVGNVQGNIYTCSRGHIEHVNGVCQQREEAENAAD